MIQLTVAQLAQAVAGRPVGVDPQLLLTGAVVTDSRLAGPGSVFVAVRGERTDGHDHAAAAHAAGAAVVVAEHAVNAPHVLVEDSVAALGELAREVLARLRAEGSLRVVGLTGSVGKTTTKDLLAQVLAHAGPTVAPRESFNNEIGLPLTVLSATRETRYLVLEMGASGPGHIDYLTRIAPLDVAVVLVVGHAHMGGFGTIDAVARAKAEIVAGLLPGGTAVLNADDARVAAMAAAAPGPVTFFGRGEGTEVRASDVTLDAQARPSFVLHTDASGVRTSHPVSLALLGEHQVSNALAVAGAALALGLDAGAVAHALSAAERVSAHRMAITHRPDGVVVLDDAYNANPDSMAAALRATAAMPARRRIAVVGEMLELGHESERAHEDVGRLAAELGVDVLVALGPAGEPVRRGAGEGPQTHCPADADAAAALLDELLQEGDLVLLKGSNGSGVWRLAERLTQGGGAAW
ncbi:UDP-N-acetylmuramoyl-tripeptide--D-alanyl-D-alanine ligase [Georgenia satyanarayanai]|uniref:UDP-N-acetylmuramoyl-tripeptide--D-alanyl-D- alanine ligase n=1 Tax=Georgenia satyanarayanai TaxID=860221 RepID=UPI00203CE60C|nr:UDP-N-acetylmuramoyl-tripeptide--D-alanyl-D-alanine ligase [Georgenia satyanarayanai]MCM3661832.1 UDP-N-acetylmuramoyl-tripeptide--D-alanyl-D-alanine ligase [Georgenia satyanarayanai]